MRSGISGYALGGAMVAALGLSVPAMANGFTVTAPDFSGGKTIPMAKVFKGSGCTGQDISPAVSWSGAPAGTKSYAVTLYDPDAPTGSGWWHWTVFDIPASVHSLARGAGDAGSTLLPKGAEQGRTDFGFSHYGGPCPPVGEAPHHYHLTVFAVKVPTLPLNAQSSGGLVGYVLHFNTIATAETMGTYGRSK